MEARTVVPPAKIPFGLIFASFMVRPLPDSAPRALAGISLGSHGCAALAFAQIQSEPAAAAAPLPL